MKAVKQELPGLYCTVVPLYLMAHIRLILIRNVVLELLSVSVVHWCRTVSRASGKVSMNGKCQLVPERDVLPEIS